MKFSVIIPLYNKAPYIRKALESVLAQTYTDYELIIVDDGSTDGSFTIAKQFIDERLKIKGTEDEVKGKENSGAETNGYKLSPINYKLIRQANSGVSAARNAGVAQAHAEYIAFLDADDWWEPTYLERMAQLINDYPDAGLYASNYYYHKDGVNIIKVDIPTGYFNYPKEYFKNFAMPVWTGATMISRKVYEETGGFPVGIKLGEDFLLWAKIALHYPVAFLNEPLAYYNNTLPPNYRATYHLHKPEEHMLFQLELAFGDEEKCKMGSVKCKGTESSEANIPVSKLSPLTSNLKSDWKSLLDMLHLLGLHSYWLSDEYYEIAQQEIDKVDMSQQYDFLVKLYREPRWIQRLKQQLLRIVAVPIFLLKRLKQKKKTAQTNIIINNKEYRKSMGLEVQ
jgi:glycosyltransferase involved in cell wall biosynthesis